MNKDKYYYLTDKTKEIKVAALSLEEKKNVEEYVEKARHFKELFSLYKVFKCNLSLMLSEFNIQVDDSIYHKTMRLNEEELYILINTHTVNLISSGKVLVESIEIYLKTHMGKNSYNSFRNVSSSKIYDEYFSYRFLTGLRNYSQHGHLPVEINKNRTSFNLDDILNKPHIKLNKALLKEMEDLRNEIINKFKNNPHISYLYTIADYNWCVIKIYYDFISTIKKDIKKADSDIKNTILNKPNIKCGNLVYYDVKDEIYHGFNPDDNLLKCFSETKKEVKKDLIKEEKELLRIKRIIKNKKNLINQ